MPGLGLATILPKPLGALAANAARTGASAFAVARADSSLRNADVPPALVSLVRLLHDAGHALASDRDEARRCIENATALLQGELAAGRPSGEAAGAARRAPLTPWQVARVTAFIDAQLSEKISLATLAAMARLSLAYFSRSFRTTVGVSPRAYVIRRRIERAQELMCRTDKPLAEIALDCGLADQAHLCRHFRHVVGMSPGAWRRLHGPAPETSGSDRTPGIHAVGRIGLDGTTSAIRARAMRAAPQRVMPLRSDSTRRVS